MANNTSNVTCPEIAKENDSEIELSTYNTSVDTKVVIGCKGFGRHVSDPTNVVCLDTGAWSKTPNLKCKIAFDEGEKVILGAAIASAVLVLFVVICLCCYCCCCRRRRRHYRHRYRRWHGWRDREKGDDWRNGWLGRESHMYFGDYSGSDKEKKTSWRSEWKKRKDMINHNGDEKDMKDGMWSRWSSRKDVSDFHGGDNEKRSGWWSGWSNRKNIDDSPADSREKSGWWSAWGSRKDLDDHHGDDKERKDGQWSRLSKRTQFEHPKEDEGRKSGWWTEWKSRVFGYSGDDSTAKRHYRFHDSNERKNFIQEYGYPIGNKERKNSLSDRTPNIGYSRRISNEDKHLNERKEMIRSNTEEFNRPTMGRRYSDPSIHKYGRYEVTYDSKPTVAEYHRVRRYSDPTAHTVNYIRPRHEIIHHSRPITFHDSYSPSYPIVEANDIPQQIIERDSIEYNRPVVRYTSPHIYRYSEPAHILDPLYYTEPHFYRSSPRYHTLQGSERLLLGHGQGRRYRQLILDPVELDKLSNYPGIDFSHRNAGRLSRHARIIELDNADRHGTDLLSKGGIGRSSGAHYAVTTIPASTTYTKGQHDYLFENRSGIADDRVRNYVLYQGKGKTTEILDSTTENGDKSRIIY